MLSVSISEKISSKMSTFGFLISALAKESLILKSSFQIPCKSSICVSSETFNSCIWSVALAVSHAHKIRSLFAFGRILWKLSRNDPGKKWLVLSTRAIFERRCLILKVETSLPSSKIEPEEVGKRPCNKCPTELAVSVLSCE